MKTIIPVKMEQTPSTIASTIHAVLQHTNKAFLSITEVMGYTSHAFRINLRKKSIDTNSLYAFHGGQSLRRNLFALGFKPLNLCPPVKTITPEMLHEIIHTIHTSVQRGLPVVGWDLFAKEFGLIYGFDDEKSILYAIDNQKDGTIPYDRLPDRRILCLAMIEESFEIDKKEMLNNALVAILDHAHDRDGLSWENLQGGLLAYDVWMDAFTSGDKITNKGNAQNLHIVSDARRHAVAFLKILSERWKDGTTKGSIITRLAAEAADHYAAVVESLAQLEQMYPYPLSKKGAHPRVKENVPRSVELLARAKQAEELGIAVLTEMYSNLNR